MRKKITLIALITIAVFFAIYCLQNRSTIKTWLMTYLKPTIIEEIYEPITGLGVCDLDA